jgi:hypothetical protein
MVFSITSVYTLEGDATKTLNTLTNSPVSGSSDISTLSSVNYPVANDSNPNAANQLVFKNQPLSWWLASLNSGAVKYTPFSNNVNWAYVDASKNSIHISMEISNLLIPNSTKTITRNPGSLSSVLSFVPKFGLTRVDTHTM